MTEQGESETGLRAPAWLSRRGALVAALVAFVVFLPGLVDGFVYDDTLLISENPFAQSLSYLLRGFRTHLWDVYAFGEEGFGLRYYRPIVSASYVLNWVLSGGAAWTFHLFNAACHGVATWLVARVASRWIGSPALGFLSALLFALHPSRTESVLWISGRTDVLMAVFTLAAVEFAHAAAGARPGRASGLAALSIAGAALSALSKEAGALTALFIGVDVLLADKGSAARARLVRIAAVTFALGVLYLAGRWLFYPVRGTTGEPTILYGFYTVWAYVERIVLPWPQTFFFRPAEEVGGKPSYPPVAVALGVCTALGFVALLVRAVVRDRAAALILVVGAALILPLLNFTYTGIYVTASDHFLYLPLFALAVGLLRLFRAGAERAARERVTWVAVFGISLVYAAIDCVRALDYRSDADLWGHELEVNPDNPVALLTESRLAAKVGDVEAAYAILKRAVRPESRRFFLLAGSRGTRIITEGRLLALRAALTADGDVAALTEISERLEYLFRTSRSSKTGLPLGADGALRAVKENAQLASLAADMALVDSRIGRSARTLELVSAIPPKMLPQVSNPLNLVLARARLLDIPAARRLLASVLGAIAGTPAEVPEEARADLATRLDRAAAHLSQAGAAADPATARTERALASAELGAYLAALRELRPVFEDEATRRRVGPLYVQLLVSARLRDDAVSAASSLLGAEAGAAAVAEMERALPPALARLPKVSASNAVE